MVEPFHLDGRRVWVKWHQGERRRLALGVLDVTVRLLGLACLRPPPRLAAADACRLETRRLQHLHARGVAVPELLAQGETLLVLADGGPSLAHCLRGADEDRAKALLEAAGAALAHAHAAGCCIGQPLARNIVVSSDDRIRFLDVEEDPLAVMNLAQAHARDWLLFATGSLRHADLPDSALVRLMRDCLHEVSAEVRRDMQQVLSRLAVLALLCRFAGKRARAMRRSMAIMRRALEE